MNEIEIREEYLLKRRRKKIKMNDLAAYVGCSQSQISKFETNANGMSEGKLEKYKKFIDQY